jgi:hypothetical protein
MTLACSAYGLVFSGSDQVAGSTSPAPRGVSSSAGRSGGSRTGSTVSGRLPCSTSFDSRMASISVVAAGRPSARPWRGSRHLPGRPQPRRGAFPVRVGLVGVRPRQRAGEAFFGVGGGGADLDLEPGDRRQEGAVQLADPVHQVGQLAVLRQDHVAGLRVRRARPADAQGAGGSRLQRTLGRALGGGQCNGGDGLAYAARISMTVQAPALDTLRVRIAIADHVAGSVMPPPAARAPRRRRISSCRATGIRPGPPPAGLPGGFARADRCHRASTQSAAASLHANSHR